MIVIAKAIGEQNRYRRVYSSHHVEHSQTCIFY
jgi:hypothetical protein